MTFGELALSAVVWATLVTLVSQGVSILVVWWLGLPPKKLVHEIEVVQNPAVGAIFFIITLTVSLFISQWAALFTVEMAVLAPLTYNRRLAPGAMMIFD